MPARLSIIDCASLMFSSLTVAACFLLIDISWYFGKESWRDEGQWSQDRLMIMTLTGGTTRWQGNLPAKIPTGTPNSSKRGSQGSERLHKSSETAQLDHSCDGTLVTGGFVKNKVL